MIVGVVIEGGMDVALRFQLIEKVTICIEEMSFCLVIFSFCNCSLSPLNFPLFCFQLPPPPFPSSLSLSPVCLVACLQFIYTLSPYYRLWRSRGSTLSSQTNRNLSTEDAATTPSSRRESNDEEQTHQIKFFK
jgi:hypothetical protein